MSKTPKIGLDGLLRPDDIDLHRDEEVTVWVPQSMFDAQPAAASH